MNNFKLLVACLLVASIYSASKDQWKSRTVYQLLTDRFARSDGSTNGCGDLSNYCGGTFQGIINKLDYITGMGFDAIWISPIISNYGNGYHGYWAKNIYEINGHFGSADDLKNLVNACHAKGVWVMVDVVANHMGMTDENFGDAVPFNNKAHYHNFCIIQDSDFQQKNMHNIQYCRLASLADLNTEDSWVASTLYDWIRSIVQTYGFDGIRIDTLPHIPNDFWSQFTRASGVYSVGEVFDGSMDYHKGFLAGVDATLNYPFYYVVRDTFSNSKSMYQIRNYYNEWLTKISVEQLSYQSNFIDNHDNARWLSNQGSGGRAWEEKIIIFKSMIAMTLTSVGIPMIYYGQEQLYAGGNDPQNRESLWQKFDTNSELYNFIKTINQARKTTNSAGQAQI